jgi:hypothetical protein
MGETALAMTRRSTIPAGIGFGLLYLAHLNSVLAYVAGTCNQGDAGRLWGAVLSLILALSGLVLLIRARPSRMAYLAALPLVPVMVWQAVFAARLFSNYFAYGMSACATLDGAAGYGMDGSQWAYAFLWVALSIIVPTGLAIALLRASAASRSPHESGRPRPKEAVR